MAGLVIFDCDGVLVDSERLVQVVDMRMIADLGWPITEQEIFDQHLGRSSVDVRENIEARIDAPLPPTFAAERDAAYLEVFTNELEPIAGVREAIVALHDRGWATCVGSSSSHDRLRLTLGLTELLPIFEGRIFSAQDVRNGKPAPDLFLHAAERMAADGGPTIVIEDSPSGVAAARAAGMPVVGYAGQTPRHLIADADIIIDDMTDLVAAIESLAG